MKRRSLTEGEGSASFVPELAAVRGNFGRGDAVEDNDATRSQHGKDFGYDFLQVATVSANEDSVGGRKLTVER